MKKDFAKEYATALFDILLEDQTVEETIQEFETMTINVSSDLEFIKLLSHPQITKEEKKNLVKQVFEVLNPRLLDFLFVLIDNNRLQYIKDIYESYRMLYNDYHKVIHVDVITAIRLSSEQENKLQEKLVKKYRKQIKLNTTIDQSVIGGMRLIINDEIIDNTLINQLTNLKSYVLKQN